MSSKAGSAAENSCSTLPHGGRAPEEGTKNTGVRESDFAQVKRVETAISWKDPAGRLADIRGG